MERGITHCMKPLNLLLAWLVLVFPNCYAQVATGTIAKGCNAYLPPGKGKELLNSLCTSCHDLTWPTTSRKDSGEWRQTVRQMLAASDPQIVEYLGEEMELLTRYLAEYFGPLSPTCETLQQDVELRENYLAGKIKSLIDINSASLTDLMRLPIITKAIAETIISYRETHGPFKTKEDLKVAEGKKY